MRYYRRFTLPQIIQHWLWALSFLVLVATGFSLLYARTSLAQAFVGLIGGPDMRSLLHRLAAMVFVATGYGHLLAYHLIPYLRRRRLEGPMVPTGKDWEDFKADVRYHLWLTDERPRFDRFSWIQKFEYWAGAIGINVVFVTGLIMWFMFDLMRYIPFQVIRYAQRIHGWEALLAVATIAILHTYNVILRPGVFPMDRSMFTGRIREDHLKEEHPLEWERIRGGERDG